VVTAAERRVGPRLDPAGPVRLDQRQHLGPHFVDPVDQLLLEPVDVGQPDLSGLGGRDCERPDAVHLIDDLDDVGAVLALVRGRGVALAGQLGDLAVQLVDVEQQRPAALRGDQVELGDALGRLHVPRRGVGEVGVNLRLVLGPFGGRNRNAGEDVTGAERAAVA
jgi:hypothetical protein